MKASIDMANNIIKNLANPVNGQDAISLTYLSSELSNYAHINGTSFNADIDMQNNRILNVKNSTNATSVVNRKSIDNNFFCVIIKTSLCAGSK